MRTWRGMRIVRFEERPDYLAYQITVVDPSDGRRRVYMVAREELEASMGVQALSGIQAMAQYQSDIQETNMSAIERARMEEEAHHLHRSAPSVVRDAFFPSQLWELLHVRGLSHSEITRQAHCVMGDRHDRDRRLRAMERSIDPPMFMEEAASIDPGIFGRSLFDTEMVRALARRIGQSLNEDETKDNMPEYTEEKFDSMGKEPVVKEIMVGAVQLSKKQRDARIKLHLQKA